MEKLQKKKWSDFLLREMTIIFFFLIFGGILLLSNTKPPENFRYPLSISTTEKEKYHQIGKALIFYGYPALVLLRLLLSQFRNKTKAQN